MDGAVGGWVEVSRACNSRGRLCGWLTAPHKPQSGRVAPPRRCQRAAGQPIARPAAAADGRMDPKRGTHMRLTVFTDYTMRTLIYLALRPDRLVTIADISEAYRSPTTT